jgi:penicillin amidase
MRIVPFIISALVTGALVFFLNRPLGPMPFPPGKFLSPQHGFWLNAESENADFDEEVFSDSLQGSADVYLDERLVPHVFAENDHDLYFIQGYLHAKFRLFQMDLQTRAAEGRASEIAGSRAIQYDREQRRLGMVFAAENAIREIEKDPLSKPVFDAYTKGVNAYINSLTEKTLPLEYRLLNFRPAPWSNFRTAVLLKMMAKMLSSGTEQDLAYSNVRNIFTEEEIRMIYPQHTDSLVPIVPTGTTFPAPAFNPVAPVNADSSYILNKDSFHFREIARPDPNNGSNNWVVNGTKTSSGAPILCNDPHLEMSLPSIWYEIQLHVPGSNTYGVSLPGSPFVIIGFNDSIAWGVTNAQRDVKDYYQVRFKDETKSEYWFNGQWEKTTLRIETIKVKGGADVIDTVAYTKMGPVMFDNSFTSELAGKRNLAVRWVAHDPSNEGMTFYQLNRAKNYNDYATAISSFDCPAQNFVFASVSGDIAIWQQGKFPARWNRQGIYVMPGEDSSYFWQGYIPQQENPHSLNPARGYLQSANQRPADSTYPYFIPGSYITPRGITIEQRLASMNAITPADMMALQNDYHNSLAEDARSILLDNVMDSILDSVERRYVDIVRNWDLQASPGSEGQTIYQNWWDSLEVEIWKDELSLEAPLLPWPEEQVTMELLKKDSALRFIDNRNTPATETLRDVVTQALRKAAKMLTEAEKEGRLAWSKFKNPSVYHLLKDLEGLARKGLPVGGNGNIVNAVTHSHGPSWRMIVQMTSPTEAYGVYPGGQSGNPGSRFYDNMIDDWAAGKYYRLWYMREGDRMDQKIKWVMKFSKKQS